MSKRDKLIAALRDDLCENRCITFCLDQWLAGNATERQRRLLAQYLVDEADRDWVEEHAREYNLLYHDIAPLEPWSRDDVTVGRAQPRIKIGGQWYYALISPSARRARC